MKSILPFASIAVLFAGVMAAAPVAEARNASPIRYGNGPIVIKGPVECEKKLVQKCHWEGNRKICVWVPGPDCEMY